MRPVFAIVPLSILAVLGGGFAAYSYIGGRSDPSIVRQNASPGDRASDLAMECLIKNAPAARSARMGPQGLVQQCADKAADYAKTAKLERAVVDQNMIAFATRLMKR